MNQTAKAQVPDRTKRLKLATEDPFLPDHDLEYPSAGFDLLQLTVRTTKNPNSEARWSAIIQGFVFGAISVLMYSSWICNQKFVDPPGDRFLKLHLAVLNRGPANPLFGRFSGLTVNSHLRNGCHRSRRTLLPYLGMKLKSQRITVVSQSANQRENPSAGVLLPSSLLRLCRLRNGLLAAALEKESKQN
jgi:hypothetical protein